MALTRAKVAHVLDVHAGMIEPAAADLGCSVNHLYRLVAPRGKYRAEWLRSRRCEVCGSAKVPPPKTGRGRAVCAVCANAPATETAIGELQALRDRVADRLLDIDAQIVRVQSAEARRKWARATAPRRTPGAKRAQGVQHG